MPPDIVPDVNDLTNEALASFVANLKIEATGTVTNPPTKENEE